MRSDKPKHNYEPKSIHQIKSVPFDGNNCVPTTGSKSLSTIGNGPTTIEVRKIPTAIFFLLLPIAIHGAKSAIQTTLSACHAANDEMSLGFPKVSIIVSASSGICSYYERINTS